MSPEVGPLSGPIEGRLSLGYGSKYQSYALIDWP
jgi:hypothetical protein